MVHFGVRGYDFEYDYEDQCNDKVVGVPTVAVQTGYDIKRQKNNYAIEEPAKPDQRSAELLYRANMPEISRV